MPAVTLDELAGAAPAVRLSPYGRRTRLALDLKRSYAERPRHLAPLEVALAPVAALLSVSPCLAGDAPA